MELQVFARTFSGVKHLVVNQFSVWHAVYGDWVSIVDFLSPGPHGAENVAVSAIIMSVSPYLADESYFLFLSRTIGVLDTNSHSIHSVGRSGIRGIYPVLSLLSHNCIRNTKLQFRRTPPYEAICR